MKNLFYLLILLIAMGSSCKSKNESMKPLMPENMAPAKTLENTVSDFDKGYLQDDLEKMFADVDTAAMFYGTDPTESWNYSTFKDIVKSHFQNKLPKMTLKNTHIIYSPDNTSAMVVRDIDWQLYKTPIRQDLFYALEKNRWILKGLTLNLTMSNANTQKMNDAFK